MKIKMKIKRAGMFLVIGGLLMTQNPAIYAKTVIKNPIHYCTGKDDGTDDTDWSYVYFGSYPQSEVTDTELLKRIDKSLEEDRVIGDTGKDVWVDGIKYRRISNKNTNYKGYFGDREYRYFKWERIKWRVLTKEGDNLFLMADKAIDCKDYNKKYVDVTWEKCLIRKWLNESFFYTAFSEAEQNAVTEWTITNERNPFYDIEAGKTTVDKVYLLSIGEAMNPDYGFCKDCAVKSASRRMQASDYANARGVYRYKENEYDSNCYWWLRSRGHDVYSAVDVFYDGYIHKGGIAVHGYSDGVVPVLHMNTLYEGWTTNDDNTSGTGGGSGIVMTPEASVSSGTYKNSFKVSLSTPTSNAKIYYTTDGTIPSKNNGKRYKKPICIQETVTLKAVAYKGSIPQSAVMQVNYYFGIPKVAIPDSVCRMSKQDWVDRVFNNLFYR